MIARRADGSARADRGLIDLDALRARVTVTDLLDAFGYRTPRHGHRTVCPVHRGANPSAFSISRDRNLYYCFRCAAGGDVFRLAEQLGATDFKQAVEMVARAGGFDPAHLPRIGDAEAERYKRLQRRRRALRAWRDRRLADLAVDYYALSEDADVVADILTRCRVRGDAHLEERFWDLLEHVHTQLAAVEWLSAQLDLDDETVWARVWLIEHRARGANAG